METLITGSKTFTELRQLYGVKSAETFSDWLDRVPKLDRKKKQRLFTPNQVKLITGHLGQP